MRRAIGVLLVCAACSKSSATGEASTPSSPEAGTTMPSIGSAHMEADGTIILDLTARTSGGTVGDARLVYPPSHAEYKKVLDHVGGLKPGESKPCPPWTDPWDEKRVEAAARDHGTRAKGWAADSFTLDITGTDQEGNAVVVLVPKDKTAMKRVQLRVDPKTYAVVRETPLP